MKLVQGFLAAFSEAASIRGSGPLRHAASFLATEGRALGSAELTALSYYSSEADGPEDLDGVKQMLRGMLMKKMDDHAEDTTHVQFCQKEMAKSKERVKELQTQIEKASADKDMLEATIADHKDKIADDSEAIANGKRELIKVNDMRQNLAAKDSEVTPGDINDQISSKTKLAGEEIALSKQQHELERDGKEREQAVKRMQREIVSKQRSWVELKQDIAGYQQELSACTEYAEQIQGQCVVPAASHEERQQRRVEEIDRLKEAQSILSGDDIYTGGAF